MFLIFLGLALSLGYGLFGAALLYMVTGRSEAQRFLTMYIGPFNTLVSFGLIWGTALIVGRSQGVIPETVEAAFNPDELSSTDYFENKARFFSLRRTISFAAELVVLSFIIFTLCHFPLSGLAEALMMIAVCVQWALAGYVGRKLRYAGMMLHSLLEVKVTRNLFKERELDSINTYIHIASTLTIIFVYVHVRGYYGAPFQYDSFIGRTAQVFLLLPAVLATPVLLIVNFLPRDALHRIYDKSIDVEVSRLQEVLHGESLNPFEKRLCLMDFSKMCRDELRYSLQLTLTDLPIAVTVLIMVLEPIIKG